MQISASSSGLSSQIASPRPTHPETPDDLLTISDAAKTRIAKARGWSENTIRHLVNEGRLASYANPDPYAGRGRGRPVRCWISESELAAFATRRQPVAVEP